MAGNTFENREIARKAGSISRRGKSQKTKEWEALKEAILNRHTIRFNKILDELPPPEFVRTYLEILKYFRPKLQSITVEPQQPPPEPRPYGYLELEQMSITELENELKLLKDDNQETSPTKGNTEAEGRKTYQ